MARSFQTPDRLCRHCGSPLTLHMYERVGPPGNMLVCPNDNCRSSLAAHKERQRKQMDKWSKR